MSVKKSALNLTQTPKYHSGLSSQKGGASGHAMISASAGDNLSQTFGYNDLHAEVADTKKENDFSRKAVLFMFSLLVIICISLFFI